MKRAILIIALTLFLFPFSAVCKTIDWQTYEPGIQKAEKQNKKVYLYFRTDWCKYCKKMDVTTFKNPNVIRFLNEHFIAIMVDGDREKKVNKAFRVTGYPDNRFLDENRKEVFRLQGFQEPGPFLFFLEYVESGAYKTMTPMEYFKSR
jgi:thioredoxin-related protein